MAIEAIEMDLTDKCFENSWIQAKPPPIRLTQHIAIVGRGPTGLVAAHQLNHKGYMVMVYEKYDRSGGLLIYGITDFKLKKSKVTRRISQLEEEGVIF